METKSVGQDIFGKKYTYDPDGFVEEFFLRTAGYHEPRVGEDGVWGAWRYERNDTGQVVRKFPLNEDGQDDVTADGWAVEEYSYDPHHRPRVVSYRFRRQPYTPPRWPCQNGDHLRQQWK